MIIDETSDSSTVSQLGVFCQNWDPENGETMKLLSMLVCKNVTAYELSSSVLNLLKENEIPKKKYDYVSYHTEWS